MHRGTRRRTTDTERGSVNKAQEKLWGPIDSAERKLEEERARFLRGEGWEYHTDKLTCLWMWKKTIHPGAWAKRQLPGTHDPEDYQPTQYTATTSQDAIAIQLRAWDLNHDPR